IIYLSANEIRHATRQAHEGKEARRSPGNASTKVRHESPGQAHIESGRTLAVTLEKGGHPPRFNMHIPHPLLHPLSCSGISPYKKFTCCITHTANSSRF